MSGLLPRTPTGGGGTTVGETGNFNSLTVGTLIVTSLANIANLVAGGTAQFVNIIASGTISAAAFSAASILADVYSNATANHTVTLSTTGGNANVLLSPNGSGAVVVHAGNALTADTLAPTTAGALTLSSTSGGNVVLSAAGEPFNFTPGGTEWIPTSASLPRFEIGPGDASVLIAAYAKNLNAYFIGATAGDFVIRNANTANTVRIGVGNAFAQVVISNTTFTSTATNVLTNVLNDNTQTAVLALNGSNQVVYKLNTADTSSVQTFTNKTIDSASNTLTITNSPLSAANINTLLNQALLTTSSPTFAAVTSPSLASASALALSTASNGNISLSPNGTGTVAVAAGKTLTVDSISPTTAGPLNLSSSSNGNIDLNPNGTGLVLITGGSTDGPLTINHTANAGAIINKTGAASSANGYRCTNNGTYAAEFGYSALANAAYAACATGNVSLLASGVLSLTSTPTGVNYAPITVASPRFELGPGDASHISLAYPSGAGNYFSNAVAGDCCLRNLPTGNSVLIGVGSAASQLTITNTGVSSPVAISSSNNVTATLAMFAGTSINAGTVMMNGDSGAGGMFYNNSGTNVAGEIPVNGTLVGATSAVLYSGPVALEKSIYIGFTGSAKGNGVPAQGYGTYIYDFKAYNNAGTVTVSTGNNVQKSETNVAGGFTGNISITCVASGSNANITITSASAAFNTQYGGLVTFTTD